MSAGRTFVLGALSFAIAALLNSETLLEMAERQPFGWKRDVLVGLAEPLHTVSRWTLLDRPGEWFDDVRGLNRDEPIDLEELVASATTTVPPAATDATDATDATAPSSPSVPAGGETSPTTAATGAPAAPTTPAPGDTAPPASPPPPTTAPTPTPLRAPTEDDPLRVLVLGDSLAQGFGQTFERYVGETKVMVPSAFYKVSSGLSRPDFFDWPAEIVRQTTSVNPEVVVIMFGANDAQKLDLDGTIYDVHDGPWQDEYRRRVGAVMDYLANTGRRVVWVGLPIMESDGFDAKMQVLNGIYRDEAAKRPNISFFDTRPLFSGPDGSYQAYLPNESGEPKLMRAQDGVHFSLQGASRLANATLDAIKAMLPAAPPA